MKTQKLALILLVLTVTSFGLSYVTAGLAGINNQNSLPESLFRKYTQKFEGREGKIRRDIDAPGVEEVRIETSATDIEVIPSEDTAVHVELEGIIVSGREEMDDSLVANLEGKTLVLGLDEELRNQIGSRFQFNFGPKRLVVRVPATVRRLSLQTASGDLDVRQMILMSVQATTASGDLGLREVTVQSSKLRTASGDLTLQGTFDVAEGATASGDLSVEFVNTAPQGQFETSSGDIRLNFRQAPSVQIESESTSGNIQIEDGLKTKVAKSPDSTAKVVRAKTTSGDISITQEE